MLHCQSFFPAELFFAHGKEKHNFEIRENKKKKDLTPNLINSVHCLLDFFKLNIQSRDTLGRCFLNALEFVDFQ